MKYFNVLTKKEYPENGEMKSKWFRAGYIKQTPNGGMYMRLFHQPETGFFVVPSKTEEEVPTVE